ncbi:MAG TPA: DUF4398 domain-containing protein [Gammaproteobacteria bacterium]|nr:DUF4398 domain-containing protein [Gammaproteobacteria bacterium]
MALGVLAGCAVAAPVQEMSNARQAVQAAREAKAEQYAPQDLGKAERLLKQATTELQLGKYNEARSHALAARQAAVVARNIALTSSGRSNE